MNSARLLLTFSTFLLCLPLFAQNTTPVSESEAATASPESNLVVLEQTDQARGGVRAGFLQETRMPEAGYEMNEDKLYLNKAWLPITITFAGGATNTFRGRIQLANQIVEVFTDEGKFEVDPKSLQSVVTNDGRRFIAYQYPLAAGEPAPLFEVLADRGAQKIFVYHKVGWRNTTTTRNPYNREDLTQKIYEEDQYFLGTNGALRPFKNLKGLLALVPADEAPRARQFAKKRKLKNRDADYANLLNYLYAEQ